MSQIAPFLKHGILGRDYGFLIPITSEDPSLMVLETKPESKKWAIAIFLGTEIVQENCIGIINDDNYLEVNKDVLNMPVTNREGKLLGSVWGRLENRIKTK